MPTQILDCAQPILQPPPEDLFNVQETKMAKRRAYMICRLTKAVNDGILAFKQAHCPSGYNDKKCIRLTKAVVHDKKQNPQKLLG